jgi:hypothetical protein
VKVSNLSSKTICKLELNKPEPIRKQPLPSLAQE